MIEGDFWFKAGDAMLRASTGGMAFGPRGTPHCFQNIGDTPGRLLVITTPSGLERFFEQFATLLGGPANFGGFRRHRARQLGRIRWPPVGISDPL